jgi:hypothetical protein
VNKFGGIDYEKTPRAEYHTWREGDFDMNFLQYEFDAGPNDIIQVSLDKPANVRLLDWDNFQKYRSGQSHTYFGGHATNSPVNLKPPHEGHWYVVVDLGGYPGTIRASAQKLEHVYG